MTRTLALWVLCLLAIQGIGQTTSHKLLWEIKAPHLRQPSYLFGLMHSTDARVFNLPDSVLIAIQNTEALATEIDFDSASYKFFEYMYAVHGEDIVRPETWNKQEQRIKSWDGGSAPQDPLAILKARAKGKGAEHEETFLDAFLYRIARQQGKVVTGLESIEQQLALFRNPDADLPSTKPDTSGTSTIRSMEDMIEAYVDGDIERIERYAYQGSTSDFFKDQVIVARNHGMAIRSDSLMRLRPTFLGVGAAHLPGPDGLINLLRKRGYSLRPVIATYNGLAKEALERPYLPKWTSFTRPQDGYRLDLPARPFPITFMEGKVCMYTAMDLLGGILCCNYVLHMPGPLSESEFQSLYARMASGMGATDQGKDFTHQGLKGKEFRVKKQGEYMRVRLIGKDRRVFMLLLGNSEKIADSEIAETWFHSLDIFEPIPILSQPRKPLVDSLAGYSIQIPAHFDRESHVLDGFNSEEVSQTYTIIKLDDGLQGQTIKLLVEDFPAPTSKGWLEKNMDDFLSYFLNATIEDSLELQKLHLSDRTGFRTQYEQNGQVNHLMAVMRGNRVYAALVSHKANSSNAGELQHAADEILGSLQLLPLRNSPRSITVTAPSIAQFDMPGPPTSFSLTLDHRPELAAMADWGRAMLYHDPATSLNQSLRWYHISPYYNGNDEALCQKFDSDDQDESKSDPFGDLGSFGFFKNGANVTTEMTVERRSFESGTGLNHARKVVVLDSFVVVMEAELLGDSMETKKLNAALATFKPLRPVSNGKTRDSKFALILKDLNSTDTSLAQRADAALSFYMPLSQEMQAIADTICARSKADDEDQIAYRLLWLLFSSADTAAGPAIRNLYASLPPAHSMRSSIALRTLSATWENGESWAIERIRELLGAGHLQADRWTLAPYFSEDSTGKRLERLAFILDHPELALPIAGDACAVMVDLQIPYRRHLTAFKHIFETSLLHYHSHTDWTDEDQARYNILSCLATYNYAGWPQLALRAIMETDGYMPAVAIGILSQNGQHVPKEAYRTILDNPQSRSSIVMEQIDLGTLQDLPKAFRKPEFIAQVALESELEVMPAQMELIERREVKWKGNEQWLYLFKIAYPGQSDWLLAFSGPFPKKGFPPHTYLPLTGTEDDRYSPATLDRLARKWVRDRRDWESENAD